MPLSGVLYTADAADEEDRGEVGGRRIMKKKKQHAAEAFACKQNERNVTDSLTPVTLPTNITVSFIHYYLLLI